MGSDAGSVIVFASCGRAVRAGLQMSKLPITTEGIMARPAIHPGEVLAEELAEIAVSPATRRYGSAIGSAPARSSGSICKAPMIFVLQQKP